MQAPLIHSIPTFRTRPSPVEGDLPAVCDVTSCGSALSIKLECEKTQQVNKWCCGGRYRSLCCTLLSHSRIFRHSLVQLAWGPVAALQRDINILGIVPFLSLGRLLGDRGHVRRNVCEFTIVSGQSHSLGLF